MLCATITSAVEYAIIKYPIARVIDMPSVLDFSRVIPCILILDSGKSTSSAILMIWSPSISNSLELLSYNT